MIRTVFGSSKSGTALIPIFGTLTIEGFGFNFSTRLGDSLITMGNGSSAINRINAKLTDLTLSSPSPFTYNYSIIYTGDISIKFLKGLKDVYSIRLDTSHGTNTQSKLNINDIESFFSQFPNLYSVYIYEFAFSVDSRKSIIKGDLSRFPNSVERVSIGDSDVLNAATDFVLNLSNYSSLSQLKFFKYDPFNFTNITSTMKLIGDLSKIPSGVNFFYLKKASAGSSITYTAGKVWASSFDTLYLPISLTPTETDNLFIDANNSVTTAIGGKLWDLRGVRTSASDTAVSGLIAKSFTVNCLRISDTILTMPLASNLLDSSTYANHATMIGTETHSLGGLQTSTGNYAYIPNKTSLDFGTGSLRFGCTVKFSAITGLKGLIGKTIAGSAIGRYGIYLYAGNLIAISQITSGTYETSTSATPYNDGNFHTIEVICDRTTGKQTLTIDGVLINTTSFTPSSDNISRNAQFMIGAYGNSTGTGLLASSELNGIIKNVFVNKF